MNLKSKLSLSKITIIISVISAFMIVMFLLFLGVSENIEIEYTRSDGAVSQVKYYSYRGINDDSAPSGVIDEFRFTPGRLLTNDRYLVFYTVHQYVEVFLDEELIYSLKQNDGIGFLRTPGSNWVKVPLFREDSNKEVCIRLTPVYKDVHTEELDFYLGSELNIYSDILRRDFSQILISTVSFVMGVVLLAVAFYSNIINGNKIGMVPVAFLAILIGLWRLSDIGFIHLIVPGKTVFLFYMSLSMLMIGSQPLLFWLMERKEGKKRASLLICSLIVSAACIIQVLLQIIGICDIRNLLPLTHGLIFFSMFILLGTMIYEIIIKRRKNRIFLENYAILLIVVGTVIDAFKYYTSGSSSELFYTLIAFIIYLLISGFSLIFSYNEQEKIIKRKEMELTQSRIVTMMSQIRSHFVFNILNAISGMCKYDPEKADMTVVRFSRYLRTNIDIMQEDNPISFQSDLRHLEDYVALEKVRFGDKIKFETDINEVNFLIPPLILQPIVENSIKHGITPKASGGTIVLSTKKEKNNVIIEIKDDGVGFDLEALKKEKSVGLKNINLRLQHMVNGKLNVESKIGEGTVTTIIIPHKEVTK